MVGGVGHDWEALAEMCEGGSWIPMWPEGQKWGLLTDFGLWQILIPNTFIKEVCPCCIGAINTQGNFILSEEPQFPLELLKFNIKQLKVKNNSTAGSIPLSK